MAYELKPCPFCGGHLGIANEGHKDDCYIVLLLRRGDPAAIEEAWNRRALESASQPGSGEASSVVCISAKELLDMLELAAPDAIPADVDRDHEQMDTEMCIGRLSGSIDDDGSDSGPGLFAWYTEYPEEGVIPLRLDRDVRASIAALAPSAANTATIAAECAANNEGA